MVYRRNFASVDAASIERRNDKPETIVISDGGGSGRPAGVITGRDKRRDVARAMNRLTPAERAGRPRPAAPCCAATD